MKSNVEKIEEHIEAIMDILEIRRTESNEDTPRRVAKLFDAELFVNRNNQNLDKLNEKMKVFPNLYDSSMIIVKDIECNTTCFEGKTPIALKGETKYIKDVKVGDEVLTFNEQGETVIAPVVNVMERKVRESVLVHISNGRSIRCTPDHPFYVEDKGWIEARDLEPNDTLRVLNKAKDINKSSTWDFTVKGGYSFGYCLGVVASDGSTWRNQVRLEVNDPLFAKDFCKHLKEAFNIDAEVTKTKYTSSFTPSKRENRYLVRVISGFLVDYLRNIFEGSTGSKDFRLPLPILNELETFKGFIYGYFMGDGTCHKGKYVRLITSNKNFAIKLSDVLGTKLNIRKNGIYNISVPLHLLDLHKKEYNVRKFEERFNKYYKNNEPILPNPLIGYAHVTNVEELPLHEITVYNLEVKDNHTYIANSVWVHNCEHHWLPFTGKVTVAYIPGEFVVGLSKIPRVVKYFSKKPQLQEQLTTEIGDYLVQLLNPIALYVEMEATHECVKCRGAENNCSTKTFFSYGNDESYLKMYYELRK